MVNRSSLTETTQGETSLCTLLTCCPAHILLLDQPFNPIQTTSHTQKERERHTYTTRRYASKKTRMQNQNIMRMGPHLMIAMQYSMANMSSESEESQN